MFSCQLRGALQQRNNIPWGAFHEASCLKLSLADLLLAYQMQGFQLLHYSCFFQWKLDKKIKPTSLLCDFDWLKNKNQHDSSAKFMQNTQNTETHARYDLKSCEHF